VINAIKFSIEEIEASDQYFDHTAWRTHQHVSTNWKNVLPTLKPNLNVRPAKPVQNAERLNLELQGRNQLQVGLAALARPIGIWHVARVNILSGEQKPLRLRHRLRPWVGCT
jgi:hypothetical protein